MIKDDGKKKYPKKFRKKEQDSTVCTWSLEQETYILCQSIGKLTIT
jgi:hypothetical protein